MPQLSMETFISQYFWLVVVLMMFHFIVSSTIIPNIILTLKARETADSGNTEEAGPGASSVARDELVRSTFSSDLSSWTFSCFNSKNNVEVLGHGLSYGEVSLLDSSK